MKIKNKFLKLYTNYLREEISVLRKMRIVFDASNGFSAQVIKALLKGENNIDSFYINDKPDGNFPGHGPDPFAIGAMDEIKKEVLRRKADLGFIFDADGDRVVIINNEGCYVHPDFVTKLYIEAYSPSRVVVDRRIGWLVTRELKNRVEIFKSKVGHSYMKDAMNKYSAGFGAEESGHYYFNIEGIYMDSGVIMAARMISAVSKINSLSKWIDFQPRYYRFGEVSFSVADIDNFMKSVKEYAKKNNFELDLEDGVSAEKEDMQFNIRPSANQPLIRMDAESISEDVLKKEVQMLQSFIK